MLTNWIQAQFHVDMAIWISEVVKSANASYQKLLFSTEIVLLYMINWNGIYEYDGRIWMVYILVSNTKWNANRFLSCCAKYKFGQNS